jgi:hypothetical protein
MPIRPQLLTSLQYRILNRGCRLNLIGFEHIPKRHFFVSGLIIPVLLPRPTHQPIPVPNGPAQRPLEQKLQIGDTLGNEPHTGINLLDDLYLISPQGHPAPPTKPPTSGRLKRKHTTKAGRNPHTARRIGTKPKGRATNPDQGAFPARRASADEAGLVGVPAHAVDVVVRFDAPQALWDVGVQVGGHPVQLQQLDQLAGFGAGGGAVAVPARCDHVLDF